MLALPLAAVLVLDASAAEMGILAAAGWLPHLVFALGAGIWVDRRRRKRTVMVATDLARAAVLLTVPLAYWLDALTVEHLIAAAFLVGALTVVFDIAWGVFFMRVVPREDVVEANGKLMTSRSLSFVLGPPGAGGLVQAFGAPVAVLVDAVSFVVSALFVRRVRVDEPQVEVVDSESVRARLAAGFRFLFGHEVLRPALACTATINLFNLGFWAIVVLYMARGLGLSAATIGILLGTAAVGGVLGALAAPAVGRRLGMGPTFTLGAVLFTAPLLLFPLASGPRPVVLAMLFAAEFLSGVGVMLLDVQGASLQLLLTPETMRARQLATFKFVNYGVRPIGALAGGLLAEAIGLREALFVAAGGAILGVLWLLPSPVPRLREAPAQTG
jgi:MFS family permease